MFLRRIVFAGMLFYGLLWAQEATTDSLDLTECIKIALENNSALKQQQYSNEAADYDVTGSYSGILPSVDVSARASKTKQGKSSFTDAVPVGRDSVTGDIIYERITRVNPSYTNENYSISGTISQNIYNGGRWWNNIRKASADKKASDFDLLSQENSTILGVQSGYYNLIKQNKLYDVYKVAVQRSEDQLQRTQKMYELGSKARLDVYQAKVNLGNDRISLLTQENTVATAKRNLNISMGRDPETPLSVKPEPESIVTEKSFDDLVDIATENQPGLKSNEYNIKSSQIGVSLSQSGYLPNLSAYFTYGRSNSDLAKVFKQFDENYFYQYGIQFSWNLFNGFTDKVNVQKAKLNEMSAREAAVDYRRNLRSRIRGYFENYHSYQEIIKINQENLDAAKEELRLAQERYQIGAGTSLEVREAQVKLTTAEQTLIAAQYNALITLAQLDNELGITEKKLKNQ